MSQKIRIKLKSYDFNLVDKSAEKIVKTVKTTGAIVTGPIPLPTKKKIFTVLKSPHVNKKSREQFQLSSYNRLLDIYSSSSKTIDALMKLELPSGVEVEIKVWYKMSGLIGKKIGMTSLYDDEGNNLACTVIEAGPCIVTQVKNKDKDGYDSVQLGFLDKKEKKYTKSEIGHFKNAKTDPKQNICEFKNFKKELNIGDVVSVDHFIEGEFVDVSGISKGKGFQGVVKRHGFAGVGQSTHGQHNRLRAPGSIGAASYPARVFKGMRMAGQMGNEKVTVQNLKVIKIVSEKNLLLLKGCVPGHKNSIITIKK